MTLTLHDRLLGRNKKREGVACDTPSLFLFYPMLLVTPSVVAIAVRMLLALRSARSSAYLASSMLTKEAALLLIIFSIPYIYIGETFLSCKDTLFSAHFPYQEVKNVLYIINLLWDICTY